jgi:hypothetical protein
MAEATQCNIFLLSLTSVPDFLKALSESDVKSLITAKVARWIVPPAVFSVDSLILDRGWDICVCFTASAMMPEECQAFILSSWTASFNAPFSLVSSYTSTRSELATRIPSRSNELDKRTRFDENFSADHAGVTADLNAWMKSFINQQEGNPPVIMFNLLAFKDIEKYEKYQEALSGNTGSRHGLAPLLFGEVTEYSSSQVGVKEWDMAAFIYYPSILHFGDMLASEDYQEASDTYRVGSLVDNPLLCLYDDDIANFAA